MGPPESPTRHPENQAAGRRKRRARRRRRCLLKGCEQRFHPRQARQRYCSEGCRKGARKWSRWKAQQKYRTTAGGKQKRNGQSQRYRERVKRRKPAETEVVSEAARVITQEHFFSGAPATVQAATSDSRGAGEARCSVTVARRADERWSESRNGSGAGNRRAFNPDILIGHRKPLTFSLSMQLEFHQLDRRWEHLRVRHPARQRRLLASLAESGQQMPIVVVAAEGQADRYVVIDGHKRIAALEQLGRDTVEAVVWPMSEAAAVLLDRSLRLSEHESALEVGWLLAELAQRFGYGLDELARRFDHSVSWVSRRLALVETLPEAIQQQVREGKIPAQVAMKFLVPAARQSLEDCQRMAAIFAEHHCDTREAGQLYGAWRRGSAAIRKRILDDPALFFKTQRQEKVPPGPAAELIRDLEMVTAMVNRVHRRLAGAATEVDHQQRAAARQQIDRIRKQLQCMGEILLPEQAPHVESSPTHHDSGAAHAGSGETRDRAGAGDFPRGGTQSPTLELHRRAGNEPSPESRTLPAANPGVLRAVQGESRASP